MAQQFYVIFGKNARELLGHCLCLEIVHCGAGFSDVSGLGGQATEPLLASEILATELTYALHQKELRGALKTGSVERVLKQFHADCAADRWLLLPLGRDVLIRAAQVAKACYQRRPPIALRTLDGVHLATALLAKASHLVTTDERMRQAACALGVTLIP